MSVRWDWVFDLGVSAVLSLSVLSAAFLSASVQRSGGCVEGMEDEADEESG